VEIPGRVHTVVPSEAHVAPTQVVAGDQRFHLHRVQLLQVGFTVITRLGSEHREAHYARRSYTMA
jgi:hypothetical protein